MHQPVDVMKWMRAGSAAVEAHLKVLGQASRLEILEALREPRTIGEIRVTTSSRLALAQGERVLTRQGIRAHLERLLEIGLVRQVLSTRSGRRGVVEYQIDPRGFFTLVEELRELTASVCGQALAQSEEEASSGMPRLVLVRGIPEGRVFELRRENSGPHGWTIGSRPLASVPLDYDRYAPPDAAEIESDAPDHLLLASAQGVTHNWKPLEVGARVPLRQGDVLGVGRSLLVFRE